MAPFPSRSPSPDTLGALPDLDELAPAKPQGGSAWPWPPALANGDAAHGVNGSSGSNGHSPATALPSFRAGCPPLIAGGGVFGAGKYAADSWIFGREPFDVIRLAFAYGIRCLDTSAYYYPSEVILGRILRVLAPEFPRASYYLSSKCGRFGPEPADFDYRPQRIRECVATSLRRLGTDYLDVVLLHDVEFVVDPVGASNDAGFGARDALSSDAVRASLGLAPSDWGVSHGKGDDACIAALAELFALKDAGVVRNVGISGYPLPVLLRISRLAFARLGRPLDALLSYSNHVLHCDLLPAYVPLFAAPPPAELALKGEWTAPFVMNGGPFSMGLLTSARPAWHPASPALQSACNEASTALEARGKAMAATALRYGIKTPPAGERMPTMVGMASVQHVHAAVQAWRSLQERHDELERDEQAVLQVMRERQVMDLCWSSP